MTDPDFLTLYMTDATVKNTVNYMINKMSAADVAGTLNNIGQDLSNDLSLDIRNVYVGAITVEEPIYVSVANKLRLTDRYVELLQQMDRNVEIMKNEGVATASDQLSVRVKLNEAQMSQIKAQNGLALSKMLLCQLCGMPLDSEITLQDEMNETLDIPVEEVTYSQAL